MKQILNWEERLHKVRIKRFNSGLSGLSQNIYFNFGNIAQEAGSSEKSSKASSTWLNFWSNGFIYFKPGFGLWKSAPLLKPAELPQAVPAEELVKGHQRQSFWEPPAAAQVTSPSAARCSEHDSKAGTGFVLKLVCSIQVWNIFLLWVAC